MKYFSAFSGIGGFELGIGGGAECVGFSEINKFATQIYQQHFPKHVNYGNITTINAASLPDFDFLCGGFPCQAFSVAGKRRGFADTRGTLFFDLARILQAKRPKLFLFENVKGLLSHDNGQTFKTIIASLTELGYDCQWQVLNSKNFGVPQNRERVFIAGHLRGTPRPEVFPFPEDEPVLNGQAKPELGRPQAQYSTTLKAGGLKADDTFITAVPLKFLTRNQKNYQGKYSFTVDTANTGGVMDGLRIRRLTPIECERLQGFPDDWTQGVSTSQRYKCLGNAVTVNVIAAITKQLLT